MSRYPFFTLLTAFGLLAAARGEITLTGDTNAPETSMFPQGAKVELFYRISGLQPDQGDLTLELNVVDEKEKSLKKFSLPVKADSEGRWSGTVKPPCERLGFYRVYTKLSNGITLPKLGSRKAGFLTYAVSLQGISDGRNVLREPRSLLRIPSDDRTPVGKQRKTLVRSGTPKTGRICKESKGGSG